MSAELSPLSRRERGIILAGWAVLGLLESGKAWLNLRLSGRPADLGTALVGNMPWWLVWAALTPLVVAAARRWRMDRGFLPAVGTHLLASALLASLHHVVVGTIFYFTSTRGTTIPWGGNAIPMTLAVQLRVFFSGFFVLNLTTYWAALGGYYALEYYKRVRAGELHAARLEGDLHQARLEALRMELNPHFLFNTLNTIASLVEQQRYDDAVRMLAQLGELLRTTLDRGRDHQVALHRELEFLGIYLDIVRTRYSDRLCVELAVDPAARHAMVPPLILQPLVENAVRHGIARRPGPARITVGARLDDGRLELTVADEAQGRASESAGQRGNGIGLANTRRRLDQLYGPAASLALEPVDGERGTRVTVSLPYTGAAEPEP